MSIIAQVEGSGVDTGVPGPDSTKPAPALHVKSPQLPEIDKSATNAIASPAKGPPPGGAPMTSGLATLPGATAQ